MTPDTVGPGSHPPLAAAPAQLPDVVTSAFDPSRGHVTVHVACPDQAVLPDFTLALRRKRPACASS